MNINILNAGLGGLNLGLALITHNWSAALGWGCVIILSVR